MLVFGFRDLLRCQILGRDFERLAVCAEDACLLGTGGVAPLVKDVLGVLSRQDFGHFAGCGESEAALQAVEGFTLHGDFGAEEFDLGAGVFESSDCGVALDDEGVVFGEDGISGGETGLWLFHCGSGGSFDDWLDDWLDGGSFSGWRFSYDFGSGFDGWLLNGSGFAHDGGGDDFGSLLSVFG